MAARDLSWDDLKVFLAVVRHGTLSAAARKLTVSQPTVSRRLAELERSLGARLFDRLPDGFVPSQAGVELLPLAEAMEQAADAVGRKGACHAHPLSLPPGKFIGEPFRELIRWQAHEFQEFSGPLLALRNSPAKEPRHDRSVFKHGHVREKADPLEHVANGTAQLHGILVQNIVAIDGNGSAGWFYEPVDHLERGGLS